MTVEGLRGEGGGVISCPINSDKTTQIWPSWVREHYDVIKSVGSERSAQPTNTFREDGVCWHLGVCMLAPLSVGMRTPSHSCDHTPGLT